MTRAPKRAPSPAKPKPNVRALREHYLEARKAWLAALAARGIDRYSPNAEGKEEGRGAKRQPDQLRMLFNAHEAARQAYYGGGQ